MIAYRREYWLGDDNRCGEKAMEAFATSAVITIVVSKSSFWSNSAVEVVHSFGCWMGMRESPLVLTMPVERLYGSAKMLLVRGQHYACHIERRCGVFREKNAIIRMVAIIRPAML